MDSRTLANEELGSVITGENAGSSYGGAIFSGSQQFTVAGGTFTNITKNYPVAPAVLTAFRTIPLREIDLQREIQLDRLGDSGVLSLRRLYSAKINRRKSTVTVAMYQGEGAEQEWRRDIAKYMGDRHPNIVQLYGTSSCGYIHAAVFNDDLIPLQQFMDLYRHSHFASVYIHAYGGMELFTASRYLGSTFEHGLRRIVHVTYVAQPVGFVWTLCPAASGASTLSLIRYQLSKDSSS
ncbi:hypothetical protein MSAN_00294500 [Mycena sanguinolenta]|uniref:Uncharacterized protein n=1 Tax=Mycena sanguinolenta TaxID=230812 RepID=A0A8H6ZAR9_9AGAR|nr:hypothetical protein MSAN_00294500 [Mycena sanguinolenta]